ncbi:MULTISPECIES: type III secretion protein [Pseudomonas]|uniref:Type III secretion protein Y n=1 Tax=Pseudomonas baetica TaxID=674054 RepID=A0ABX4Q1R9_9PSED|nr:MULTISPECIES: type III secretion protein [Pseudomonas]PKA70715.1 type III secretion protein Y [Pseudomonas baetica]PTC16286.1 type III secretion protein [Pseudomonas baetica]
MMLKPVQQNLLLLLGWLQLQCGQPGRARIFLEALLVVDPAHCQARRALVVALLQLEEGVLAERQCDQLLADGEDDLALWGCVSRACQLQGRIADARVAHERFLSLRESHERAV